MRVAKQFHNRDGCGRSLANQNSTSLSPRWVRIERSNCSRSTRISALARRVGAHLFEEFTPLFRVESAFPQSASNFNTVFRQQVSAEMLEAIARHGGAKAD